MNSKIYIVNVVVCISVICFCAVKVLLDPRPETTSIYLPVATGIVGYFVPQPKKDKQELNINDEESLASRLSKRIMIGGGEVRKKQENQESLSTNSSEVIDV